MDTPVQLSMREILAVSSEVSSYLHNQTRKRRVPVDPVPVPAAANAAILSSSVLDADVGSAYLKKLYACPSGRAKVTLDREVDVYALLNNGSELNMMLRSVFERTELPIDTEIRWRIDKYDSKTNAELDNHGPLGVSQCFRGYWRCGSQITYFCRGILQQRSHSRTAMGTCSQSGIHQ